jgi:ribosome maturation protein SDO1
MSEAGFSVKQNKTAKSQVSECIKLLQTESKLPIQRARMRIRLTLPAADGTRLRQQVLDAAEKVERDETSEETWEIVRVSALPLTLFFVPWQKSVDPSCAQKR